MTQPRPSEEHPFKKLEFRYLPAEVMEERALAFYEEMSRRRSARKFSTRPVSRTLVEHAIRTASTAPSGAHQQPWTFVVMSDPEVKARIRAAAEEEERKSYSERMPQEWLDALAPLGTDFEKTHITDAPYLVVLFRQVHGVTAEGGRRTHYYSLESCGIAAGLFIAAIHHMGLATLTHTPSPMGFLREILNRPDNEKPFLLMPVGYPAEEVRVPDLQRKPLDQVSVWIP